MPRSQRLILDRAEERLGRVGILASRDPVASLPTAKRPGIDAEKLGECRLGQSPFTPIGE